MDFLYFLEDIRNSVLDFLMLGATKLGEETIFMLVAVYMLWCVDKYKGYYLLFVGFSGIQINQLLKASFKVPRPWIKNPNFSAVESAVPEATGYSFPSGHTQVAVGTYGTIFAMFRKKWVRILCGAICIVIPFSRMYLGVHTPADVGVSFISAVLLVMLFGFLFKKINKKPNGMRILLVTMTVISVITTAYMTVKLLGETEKELVDALENFYKMLGAVLGMFAVYELDIRFINFKTKAVWWAQIIKVVIGLGIILAIKLLGYKFFGAFLWMPVAKSVTYLILVIFAGAVWPLTFKCFSRFDYKKESD
jgi:undecaprenyl-diphosphatase